MPRAITTGSTDVSLYFVMRDSTTHAPKTDATITDIDIYYQEQGAAQSDKADLTALAAADSAHADNKGYHCGNGLYRIDWPDAAFDGGLSKTVLLIVVCAGCDTIYREIQLSPPVDVASVSGDSTAADNLESACDNYSATRGLAGTALPAAVAAAAGGLPVSTAGSLDLDTKLGYLQAAITSTILGRIDATITSRSSHDAAAVVTALGTGSGLTALATQASVNTIDDFLDTEIAFILDWIQNKLIGTDNEDGTITYVLYADDGTTPLKTWVVTTATGTRAAAT